MSTSYSSSSSSSIPSVNDGTLPSSSSSSAAAGVGGGGNPGPLIKSLPSGLVLRFEVPSSLTGNKNDGPITIGTPPGTPIHMSSNNLQQSQSQSGSSTLNKFSQQPPPTDSSQRGTPPFKSINNDSSNTNRGSPMLSPLGLPPVRVDTDEDLMQKQVSILNNKNNILLVVVDFTIPTDKRLDLQHPSIYPKRWIIFIKMYRINCS